jgi:hypothetical protein
MVELMSLIGKTAEHGGADAEVCLFVCLTVVSAAGLPAVVCTS